MVGNINAEHVPLYPHYVSICWLYHIYIYIPLIISLIWWLYYWPMTWSLSDIPSKRPVLCHEQTSPWWPGSISPMSSQKNREIMLFSNKFFQNQRRWAIPKSWCAVVWLEERNDWLALALQDTLAFVHEILILYETYANNSCLKLAMWV